MRFPGGFWAQREWMGPRSGEWFGTTTVEALVTRGVATYTEWSTKGSSPFPVEVTISVTERDADSPTVSEKGSLPTLP